MAICDDVPMTHEIRLNGQELIQGDRGSIAVIFNNLSGVNFKDEPSWHTATHPAYMEMMEYQLGVSLASGELEFASLGGAAQQTASIPVWR